MLLAQTANLHRKQGTPPIRHSQFMIYRRRKISDVEKINALRSSIQQQRMVH